MKKIVPILFIILFSCSKEQTQGSFDLNNSNMNKEIGTTTGANDRSGGNTSENANSDFITNTNKGSAEKSMTGPAIKDIKHYSVPSSADKSNLNIDTASPSSHYYSIEPRGAISKKSNLKK